MKKEIKKEPPKLNIICVIKQVHRLIIIIINGGYQCPHHMTHGMGSIVACFLSLCSCRSIFGARTHACLAVQCWDSVPPSHVLPFASSTFFSLYKNIYIAFICIIEFSLYLCTPLPLPYYQWGTIPFAGSYNNLYTYLCTILSFCNLDQTMKMPSPLLNHPFCFVCEASKHRPPAIHYLIQKKKKIK